MGFHPNLIKFASRLINGDCKCVLLGDSLCSETSDNRWPESILKHWDIPWQGRYVPAGTASATDNGVQNFSLTSNLVAASGTMEDGSNNPLPHSVWEEQRINIGQGTSPRRWLITALGDCKRGSWTDGNDLTVRALMWDGANGIGGRYRVSQNSAGADAEDNDYTSEAGLVQDSTIKEFEVTVTPHPGGTDSTWDWVIEGSGSIDESTGLQACGGALFYNPNATKGLQLGVLASSGFDSHDHRSSASGDPSYHAEGQWSDTQIRNYAKHLRLNTAIISIVNTSSTETSSGETLRGEFKSNLEYILERWRTAMWRAAADNDDLTGFGPPLFLLLAPWTVVNTTTEPIRDEWYNAALELQDEYPDVATIYMNPILDDWFNATWTSWNGTYLSDTTHQNAAAMQPFGESSFAVLKKAFIEGKQGGGDPNKGTAWRRARRVSPETFRTV